MAALQHKNCERPQLAWCTELTLGLFRPIVVCQDFCRCYHVYSACRHQFEASPANVTAERHIAFWPPQADVAAGLQGQVNLRTACKSPHTGDNTAQMTGDSPTADARSVAGLASSAAAVKVSRPADRNGHTAVIGAPSAATTVASTETDGSAAEESLFPICDDLTQGMIPPAAWASTACVLRLARPTTKVPWVVRLTLHYLSSGLVS